VVPEQSSGARLDNQERLRVHRCEVDEAWGKPLLEKIFLVCQAWHRFAGTASISTKLEAVDSPGTLNHVMILGTEGRHFKDNNQTFVHLVNNVP